MSLAEKWPEMVVKWPTHNIVRFISDQSYGINIITNFDDWVL
jgi:hypothetical protein